MSPPQRSLSWNLLSRLLLPYFLKCFLLISYSLSMFLLSVSSLYSLRAVTLSLVYGCIPVLRRSANSANICFIDIFSVSTLYFSFGSNYYLYIRNIFLNINSISANNLENSQMIFLWKFLPEENTYTYNIFLH